MSFNPPTVTTEVKTQKPTSRAFIGNQQVSITFPFNPETASWNYNENIASMDTLGGRVVQLLSINLESIELTMKAGSRKAMQDIMTKLKTIMGYHVNTLNPVQFKVPSRNWNFSVYVENIPDAGWNYASTSYPFSITLRVEDDISGVKTKQISNEVITRIKKDVGYSPHMHGGDSQKFYDIIETISKPPEPSIGVGAGIGTGAVDCTGNGTEEDGYENGRLTRVQICSVPGISPGVNSEIAQNVANMVAAAKADGVTLAGSAFRSMSNQISLYKSHGCSPAYSGNPIPYKSPSGCSPPTAYPGYSNHQMGRAIDFANNGQSISSSSEQFRWLSLRAQDYGLKNLPSESWHWSVNGN